MPNSIYTPTPQNPSYPSIGTVAGSTTTYAGATTAVPSGSFTFNGLSSADLTIASNSWLSKPVCEMSFTNSIVGLVFNTSDGATDIKLEFAPEPTMTVSELMKITMFITIANTGRLSKTDAFDYVRTHSLERHFKFSV